MEGYSPDGGDYFKTEVLKSEAMRKNIATAMWAQRMEEQGVMQHARDKARIKKAVDEILDNVYIYLTS